MSALAALAVALGVLAAGEGAVIGLQVRAHRRGQAAAAASLATEQDARRAEVATLTGDLAECRARVVPESLEAAATGTTAALDAALAPELAEVQARAALVSAASQMAAQSALLAVASPQMLAAEVALSRCSQMTAIKGADLAGCGNNGPVIVAWSRAVEGLAECPICPAADGAGE
jgi:hypothetical protein